MGVLSRLFGGGKRNNPANAAMPYLNQIAPMARQNLTPYIEQGQALGGPAANQYAQMVSNPAQFHNMLRATYNPSKGYESRFNRLSKIGESAAAAGGYTGTFADQDARMRLANSLLAEDENAYLDRLYGALGMGLSGAENAVNRGFGASSDLTNVLGSTLGAQGSLAFKGQENQNATRQEFMRYIMQALGAGAGAYFGGVPGAVAGGNAMGANAPYPSQTPNSTTQFGFALPPIGKSPLWGGNF